MNLPVKFTFLALVFLSTLGLKAQDLESLSDRYFELIDKYLYVNTDSALYYSEKLLEVGIQYNDSLTIAEGYKSIGSSYYYQNKFNKAIEYFDKSEPILKNLDYHGLLGGLYMLKGNVYGDLGQFAKCVSFYEKAENLFRPTTVYAEDLALLYYNIAHAFMDLKDVVNLEKYISKAEAIIVKNEIDYMATPLKNIKAHLAIQKGEHITAKALSKVALYSAKREKDLLAQIFAYENLAAVALKLNPIGEVIAYQDSALFVAQLYGDDFTTVLQKAYLARYYLMANNLQTADSLAHSSFVRSKQLGSLILIKETSKVYSKILQAKGIHEEALDVYKLHHHASDSMYGFELSERVLRSENKLAEQKNALLNSEAAILKANNENNKLMISGTVVGFVLSMAVIALLAVILYSRKKAIKELNKKQQQIDEKQEELKKKNLELERTNKGKDKMFSILTHDLRQPFNQIASFIQILEHTPELDPMLQELVGQMKEQTNHTLTAMDNLLVWSKSQFMEIKTSTEKFNVEQIIKHIVTEMTASINAKKLTLNINVETEANLSADRNHVEIIVRNLLSNAIKFSPSGGTIEVSVIHQNDGVEILVRDEGKGMTEQEMEQLFDSERHFSTPGTLNEKGTGLGMLIISEFVKENKGRINIDSEKNKGSTFKVILPAA